MSLAQHEDRIGWHMRQSIALANNAEQWRAVVFNAHPEDPPKWHAIYRAEECDAAAAGHLFRAAELAYDMGAKRG